jgi:hypothetical protein
MSRIHASSSIVTCLRKRSSIVGSYSDRILQQNSKKSNDRSEKFSQLLHHQQQQFCILSETLFKTMWDGREITCVNLCCVVLWCDVMWCDVMWCDVMWCVVMCCVVLWCDVMWCDVMWCDVMWCDEKRCDVVNSSLLSKSNDWFL